MQCASCHKSSGVFLEHGSVLVFCKRCRAISRASCEVVVQPERKRNVNDLEVHAKDEGQSLEPAPSRLNT